MATNPNTLAENAGRITAPDANYPYGSAKDDSTGTTGDGTPIRQALMNDTYGLQQALLRAASIVPTGNADTGIASQYLQAVVQQAAGRAVNYDESGAANAYVLDLKTNQQGPAAYFDGMIAMFEAGNANTGASTVNVAGLGSVNIKLKGGSADPAANDILTGRDTVLIYRTSPSAHFELQRLGQVKTTVVTVTNAAWAPQPDTKVIKFIAVGAGGGGGGGAGGAGGAFSAHGGGGGTCIKTTPLIDATYNITIGAGGTGGAAGANNGTDGGDTTVVGSVGPGTNVNLLAGGGDGGLGDTNSSGTGTLASTAGGAASGGSVNLSGGQPGMTRKLTGTAVSFNASGVSFLGGAVGHGDSAAGPSASVYGAGGGGVVLNTPSQAGGDGADGVVIVEEYL